MGFKLIMTKGLVSHGGVHSKQTHLYALLKLAKEMEIPKVFIHFFGDGRDTKPKSGADYMQELVDTAKEIGIGEIATVVGRYYAMDRDKRWERVKVAVEGLVNGVGEEGKDLVAAIEERYKKDETDEFLKPIIVNGDEGRIKGMQTTHTRVWYSDILNRIRRRYSILLQLPFRSYA